MKKNKDRIDRIYSFFNAIRGNNIPSEHESTLAMLKKVIDIHEQSGDEFTENDLYHIMRQVADDFGVNKPFPAEKKFLDVYRTLRGFESVTWTDIIEYGNRKSKFRVPEPLIDEMEKTLLMFFKKFLFQRQKNSHLAWSVW